MPTDAWFKANPKISGYVPQVVYDRLIQFKDERGISISQAVTTVLSEYFGIDRVVDQSSFAGVTLAQVQELEQELAGLAKAVEQRFQDLEDKLGCIEALNNLPVNHSKPVVHSLSSLISEPVNRPSSETNVTASGIMHVLEQDEESGSTSSNNELLSKPLNRGVEANTQTECQDLNTGLLNELKSKPLKKEFEEVVSNPEPLDETGQILSVQPLSGEELSQRLGVQGSVITRYKNGKRKQSLVEWSKTLDPEDVGWDFSEELKKYVPVQNIANYSTTSLQIELLPENQKSATKLQPEKAFDGTPFTEEELAVRFGMSTKRSIQNHRTGKQAASFSEWTQSKDPDGITWQYIKESKMYYPVELPSKPVSKLLNSEVSANLSS